jgi:subfamily B ATP-binding cassette protein HlyB/CyaB
MQKKWEDYLAKYVNSSFHLNNLSNILGGLSGMLQKLMTISILYMGVTLVLDGKMSVGQLIAFQMFANQFSGPVLRLVNLWNEFQQTLLSVDRLGDILNTPTEQKNDKAITLPKIEGNVVFDNITFSYAPDMQNVINGISAEFKAGQSIGLVGRSGSGKSTITKLLQRLYVPNSGTIYIDGVDIRHMNPKWLRNNIGVVLQENYLFSVTIKDISPSHALMPRWKQYSQRQEWQVPMSLYQNCQKGMIHRSVNGEPRSQVVSANALPLQEHLLLIRAF